MKNKTIANFLIITLVGATYGNLNDSSEDFFIIIGISMIVFSWIAFKHLYNTHKPIAQWLLGVTIALFAGSAVGFDEIVVLAAIGYWIISITAIVKLYQTKEE